jgi:hypothetical protein
MPGKFVNSKLKRKKMLQFMENLPSHVVGIHATGEVDKDDYEKVLIPRIEELVARQHEIDYLLVLDTGVQNFSAAAWFEDFKLALKHFSQLNKIAVVTDQKGVEWFTDIVRFFIPGKAKGFPLAELDEAIKWISEKDNDKETQHPNTKPANSYTDNDDLEPSQENSSNKGQGPAGENL